MCFLEKGIDLLQYELRRRFRTDNSDDLLGSDQLDLCAWFEERFGYGFEPATVSNCDRTLVTVWDNPGCCVLTHQQIELQVFHSDIQVPLLTLDLPYPQAPALAHQGNDQPLLRTS